MSELLAYVEMGFRHITDLAALDHILFLLALAAIYRPGDWRAELVVVSAFTVGHSITLALAVSGLVRLPMSLIEFLIPVTIVATCAENLVHRRRGGSMMSSGYRPLLAGGFGLVHGAGFANYLRDMFAGSIGVPLFGFNLGIELGQIVVLVVAGLTFSGLDRLIGFARASLSRERATRLRVVATSAAVMIVAGGWAFERSPW